MMKKFYKCEICGKIAQVETEGPGKLFCCGKPMAEMTANSTEAAVENVEVAAGTYFSREEEFEPEER